jgi:type VI secretion system protein
MPLKLTITSFQRLSPDQEATKLLDRGAIGIGRAAQNDWVLQDPERILSKNHCTVHYQDGAYFLTDLSANGTFLNDSDQRIPRNQTVPLQDGDRFTLGEYEIEATLIPGAAELEETGPVEPLTDIIPVPHILPASGGDSGPAVLEKPSFADLLAEDQDHLPITPPPGRTDKDVVVTEPSPDLLAPDRAFFEPPELLPGTPPLPVPEPIPAEILPPVPPRAESESPIQAIPDLIIPDLEPPSEKGSETPIQVIPDLIIPAPTAANPVEKLIPDDWWLGPPAQQPASEPIPSPLPPAEPARVEPLPVEPLVLEQLAPSPPPAPATAKPPPTPSPPPIPTVVESPPVPSPPPAPAAVEPAGLDAEALIRAFLEGAGLSRVRPTAEQRLEIMTNLGAIFRETVQGLTDILRARGDIKGEFRLDRTAIGPMENNPLKTPPGQSPLGLEEIMTLLLMRQKDAYMSPVQAVHEGFKDIKDHQVAVWAGVQTALDRLLERFDPRNLETRLHQTVLDSILPASRKAKYWDLFTTEYQAIAREAEDDFNELFGDEFARAYEEWLRGRR